MRIQKQINELEAAKETLRNDVYELADESQRIAEWLDGLEYEALKKENL